MGSAPRHLQKQTHSSLGKSLSLEVQRITQMIFKIYEQSLTNQESNTKVAL